MDNTPDSPFVFWMTQVPISQDSKRYQVPPPDPKCSQGTGLWPELSSQMSGPGALTPEEVSQGPWGQQEACSASPRRWYSSGHSVTLARLQVTCWASCLSVSSPTHPQA